MMWYFLLNSQFQATIRLSCFPLAGISKHILLTNPRPLAPEQTFPGLVTAGTPVRIGKRCCWLLHFTFVTYHKPPGSSRVILPPNLNSNTRFICSAIHKECTFYSRDDWITSICHITMKNGKSLL